MPAMHAACSLVPYLPAAHDMRREAQEQEQGAESGGSEGVVERESVAEGGSQEGGGKSRSGARLVRAC